MKSKNWFEVSKEGLKQLQESKTKDFVLRELIQNAWDEDGITYCHVIAKQQNGIAYIEVEDDAPEGFRDITHAFMLFAPTYKRKNPEKRGRYNIGEKQVLAICKIDCIYHIDVHQKIPLSIGRETVSQSYLQKVFTIALNETHAEIPQGHVSDVWVKEAMSNKNISNEAVQSIVKSRYGDKVLVAAPRTR